MMEAKNWILLAAVCLLPAKAWAIDAACTPMVTASEARIKQAAWHSQTQLGANFRIEHMKLAGSFYSQNGGVWKKSPVSFDEAEKTMVAQIKSGETKLTGCSSSGSDVVDGVAVTVFKSRIEMKGAPARDSTLYIGKADGLPYRQVAEGGVNVTYKYKNITAPKL